MHGKPKMSFGRVICTAGEQGGLDIVIKYKFYDQYITTYMQVSEEERTEMGGQVAEAQCVFPCEDGMKLDEDGAGCVYDCGSGKYQEDEKTHQMQCVSKCEHWWYKEQGDGFCKKEAWRKNTAIAVPIVVVVVAVAVVVVVLVLKKKNSSSSSKVTKMEGEKQVTAA